MAFTFCELHEKYGEGLDLLEAGQVEFTMPQDILHDRADFDLHLLFLCQDSVAYAEGVQWVLVDDLLPVLLDALIVILLFVSIDVGGLLLGLLFNLSCEKNKTIKTIISSCW